MNSSLPVREPAVAGRFYPASKAELESTVRELTEGSGSGEPAILAMAPHAGYMYSGRIAGETYARVAVPQHVLVLGPNHTGLGPERSLWSGGAWRSPLGDVPISRALLELVRNAAICDADREAHRYEHSIEVQLPFLQVLQPRLNFVPLCLGQLSLPECVSVGEALAGAIRAFEKPVLIVCSTDMSHYISADSAARLDRLALDRVEDLDPSGLYQIVTRERISMCGFIPTTVGLVAARALGARRASLVRYGNSGESSGDFARVVGYAGLTVS